MIIKNLYQKNHSNFRWLNDIEDDSEISEVLKNAIGTQLPLDYNYQTNKNFENNINMNTSTTVEFLKKIAPRCKDLLLSCQWEGKTVECTDVRKKIFFFNFKIPINISVYPATQEMWALKCPNVGTYFLTITELPSDVRTNYFSNFLGIY